MTVHILRHGETEYNRLGIVQGSGVDTDLNSTGQFQAQAFFDRYRDLDFDLIVTSKLRRTRQTVRQFIEKDLHWIQDADLNEISWGDHEGLATTPQRLRLYENMLTEWRKGNFDAALPNGESAGQLAERLERVIAWLRTRPAERILICTHGRTMRALVTLMKGLPLNQMEGTPHANTGCYVARLEQNRFVFDTENCTAHLQPMPETVKS